MNPDAPLLLVVEDDPDFSFLIRRALKDGFEECQIRSEINGFEAFIRLMSGMLPTAIITDLNLPGMKGRELISIVRREPKFDGIPIFVYSASEKGDDRDFCQATSNCHYVPKKCSPKGLCAHVHECLAVA